MIQNKVIKKAIYDKLKAKFNLPVYYDEVIDGMAKPCFFVEVEISNETSAAAMVMRHLTATITYYQSEASEADKMQKQDDLASLFLPIFAVSGRNLTTATAQSTTYGDYIDVTDFVFTTDFYDDLPTTETTDMIENVEFITRKE